MITAPDIPVKLSQAERLRFAQAAYDAYRASCFWSMRRDLVVTEANLPMVIEGLKEHGGHKGWKLAQALCR